MVTIHTMIAHSSALPPDSILQHVSTWRAAMHNHAQGKAQGGPIAPPASDAQATLSRAEVAARSLAAPTASERRRWQVIGLLADGVPLAEIVTATSTAIPCPRSCP